MADELNPNSFYKPMIKSLGEKSPITWLNIVIRMISIFNWMMDGEIMEPKWLFHLPQNNELKKTWGNKIGDTARTCKPHAKGLSHPGPPCCEATSLTNRNLLSFFLPPFLHLLFSFIVGFFHWVSNEGCEAHQYNGPHCFCIGDHLIYFGPLSWPL